MRGCKSLSGLVRQSSKDTVSTQSEHWNQRIRLTRSDERENGGMSRIPYIAREDFTEAQQRLFESIIGGKRGRRSAADKFLTPEGGMRGPFNAWLYSPILGDAAQRLGEAVRFESTIPPTLRELAILMVAAKWKTQYEWWAHERISREEGLDEHLIQSLKEEVRPHLENPAAEVVYDFTRELIDRRRVSDRLYDKAVATLGEAGVVELVMLVGYYTLVSMTLNVFEVPVPAAEKAPFVISDRGEDPA